LAQIDIVLLFVLEIAQGAIFVLGGSMFVVYVDLDDNGRFRPVPCKEFKPVPLLGDGWYKMTGIEQIKEMARPTMTVTDMIIQRKHINYIIGGDDPADIPDVVKASMMTPTNAKNEPESESEPSVQITKEQIAEPPKPKAKLGRPKGSKNKPKTNQSKK